MTTPIPDLTGYIFSYKSSFWKVRGPKQDGYSYGCVGNSAPKYYPVVKCTKHGKEFKHSTNIRASMVEKLYLDGDMVKCGLTEDVKVSTAGKASGARKRRITHLVDEVNRNLAELNKLLQADGAPYTYTLSQS